MFLGSGLTCWRAARARLVPAAEVRGTSPLARTHPGHLLNTPKQTLLPHPCNFLSIN